MIRPLFIVSLFLQPFWSMAQNPANASLVWNVVSVLDVQAALTTDSEGTLVTKPNEVEWIDHNESNIYTLEVKDIKGSWANVHNSGSVSYLGQTKSGNDSSVIIERKGPDIVARIFVMSDDGPVIHELTISNVAWIN